MARGTASPARGSKQAVHAAWAPRSVFAPGGHRAALSHLTQWCLLGERMLSRVPLDVACGGDHPA